MTLIAASAGFYWASGLFGINLLQQTSAGAVQPRRVACAQPRLHVFGQHLAQLHAPLVKAVDAPQRAADKNAVVLQRDQRDQRAQAGRRQFIEQEKSAGAVAGLMLTTEAMVAEAPKDDAPAGGGMGGGMGGMDM